MTLKKRNIMLQIPIVFAMPSDLWSIKLLFLDTKITAFSLVGAYVPTAICLHREWTGN
jgi:hypothetical protein